MKVLLLGATGNLGSRIVPALLFHKHEVVIYVRSEGKLKELLPTSILSQVTTVKGDATDAAAITDALVKHNCNALVNSAGQPGMMPWHAPRMQDIVNAVVRAVVDASKKLNHPIRAWLLGGMSALDYPGRPGTPLSTYLPIFKEHKLTYVLLSSQPKENIQWSLLCPSVMAPVNKSISPLDGSRTNPLTASADVPPGWQHSMFKSVPFFGTLFSIFGNAPKYNIMLEDCADFIASDLENPHSEFVGHRVGLRDLGKAKAQ